MNVCPICQKIYKRPEHLRRHLISHSSQRPYICARCGSTFQRTDVLRRHQQACEHLPANQLVDDEPPAKRISLPLPPIATIRDDLELATQSSANFAAILGEGALWSASKAAKVERNAEEDAFIHVEHGSEDTADFWHDFLKFDDDDENEAESLETDSTCARFLGFLTNFTTDSGLIHSFDCGTAEQRATIAAASATGPRDGREQQHGSHRMAMESQWLTDTLCLKSHEIVTAIQDIVVHKPRQSSITLSWSPMVAEACTKFFSPANLHRFLALYWALWHPNVNIMHKATFHPPSSKAYLLATMALIGASVSTKPEDASAARQWFNCVEEIVFTSDDFCNDTETFTDRDTGQIQVRQEKLRVLQAAYMVLLYQNWEGSDSSKRRVRRLRFSSVVAAVRDVGMHTARHPQLKHLSFANFSFTRFATVEELIRVNLWVFLLDTAFVIFNNLPPRMTIREMDMGLACPESCFQATTAEDCFKALQRETSKPSFSATQKLRFATAFELLYQHPLPHETTTLLADLGPLNLFAMTSTLHSLVFHHQNTFSGHNSIQCVQDALQGWRHVWQIYTTHFSHDDRHMPLPPPRNGESIPPQDMWRRLGFMRHAEEYWLLAKLIVDSLAHRKSGFAVVGAEARIPGSLFTRDSAETHEARPLLRNYDETSMQQVNELIADLQRFGI